MCPGLGRTLRGYERFAAELFETLESMIGITLFRGAGETAGRQVAVGGAGRDGITARALGAISHDAFYWEAVTFAALAWRRVRAYDLLHYSEPPLNLAFTRLERARSAPAPRLFSHALNMDAAHTLRCHHIHQTSPDALDDARRLGVPEERMTLLPYGVFTERFRADRRPAARATARAALGVPLEKPVVLVVSALNRKHKRVDKVIAAIARLDTRPHLLVCGSIEDPTLLEEAKRTLGSENVTHAYVANDQMVSVYAASDLFVMPSLVEGFGLAAVEAQLCGVPAIVHDSAHFRWLMDVRGARFADMRSVEALAISIAAELSEPGSRSDAVLASRDGYVSRYDWSELGPRYLDMYSVASRQSPHLIETIVEH